MKTKVMFCSISMLLIVHLEGEAVKAQNPEWKVYTERCKVTCMAEEGPYLWVGTNDGLVKCDKDSGTSIRYNLTKLGLPSNRILSIAVDSSGNKWIGIGGQGTNDNTPAWYGLAEFNGTTWDLFNTSNSGLPSNMISCLAVDHDGKTWIGSDRGLASYDGTRWTVFDTSNSALPSCNITCLAVDSARCIWIGTDSGLVELVDTALTAFTPENSGLPVKYIRCIAVDTAGAVWAYGEKYGAWWDPVGKWLVRYNGANWLAYSISELGFSGIDCIAADKSDSKWVVLTSGALIKFDDFGWRVQDGPALENSYSHRFSLFVDTGEVKWVGTAEGLFKYDGQSWTILPREAQLPSKNLSSVAIEGNRNVWVGTSGDGMAKFDGCEWVLFKESNSPLPSDYIQSVAVSRDGIVMMKTLGGVVTLEDTSWTIHGIHGIPIVDAGGSLWVAAQHTLFQFDGAKWEVFSSGNSWLPSNGVSCIAIDKGGNKWIATDGGLAAFNEAGIIVHEAENKLGTVPSNFILYQNYPNPFNPTTTISYELSANCFVSLKVYDVLGREVKVLVNESKRTGRYEIQFDASGLASGVYFYRIKAGEYTAVMKMLLLK